MCRINAYTVPTHNCKKCHIIPKFYSVTLFLISSSGCETQYVFEYDNDKMRPNALRSNNISVFKRPIIIIVKTLCILCAAFIIRGPLSSYEERASFENNVSDWFCQVERDFVQPCRPYSAALCKPTVAPRRCCLPMHPMHKFIRTSFLQPTAGMSQSFMEQNKSHTGTVFNCVFYCIPDQQ